MCSSKNSKLTLMMLCSILGLLLALPGVARAEMANNLSNPGCVSCHQNYPNQHKVTNCSPCHGGYLEGTTAQPNFAAMWNCRYCHLTKVFDTYPLSTAGLGYPDWTGSMSGFRSWGTPLHNGPLEDRSWWQAGHFGNGGAQYLPPNPPRVDADFNYHTNSTSFQHNSVFPEQGCASCHKTTLTATHEGKSKLINDPVEDFEDGAFVFNFTGYWGGEFSRVSDTAYTGSYSFKSTLVGGSASKAPTPSATTETTVNVPVSGNVSFVYKAVGSGKFSFYIDGVEMLAGGASTVWTPLAYPLTAGTHNLKWKSTWSSIYLDNISVSGASTSYSMECNTCHLSSDPAVKTAISTHNTNCVACHSSWNHETQHVSQLDASCQTCHQPSLTQEHITNSVTQATYSAATGRTALNCDTCHSNASEEIKRTVEANNLNCAGCHQMGHNIKFVDQIPSDIVLHTVFKWSTPMEASLFINEPGAPSGYENGHVIISDRSDLWSLTSLLGSYQADMMSGLWTLKTPELVPTYKNGFTTVYEKAGREVTVICFGTVTRDYKPGVLVGGGYRIEIWYR